MICILINNDAMLDDTEGLVDKVRCLPERVQRKVGDEFEETTTAAWGVLLDTAYYDDRRNMLDGMREETVYNRQQVQNLQLVKAILRIIGEEDYFLTVGRLLANLV